MLVINRKLDRATVYLENALSNWRNASVGDSYLDATCFNLSVSIELGLKYLYDYLEMDCPRQYDIKILLSGLSGILYDYPYYNELLSESNTITGWYTGSRYLDDFDVKRSTVYNVIMYVRNLIDFCTALDSGKEKVLASAVIQGILDFNRTGLLVSDIEDFIPPIYLKEVTIPYNRLLRAVMYSVKQYHSFYGKMCNR